MPYTLKCYTAKANWFNITPGHSYSVTGGLPAKAAVEGGPFPDGTVIQFWNWSHSKPINIASDSKSPYSASFDIPTESPFIWGVEIRVPGQKPVEIKCSFVLKPVAPPAKPPATTTDPTKPQAPDKTDDTPPAKTLPTVLQSAISQALCECDSLHLDLPVTSARWTGTKTVAQALVAGKIRAMREWFSIQPGQTDKNAPNWDVIRKLIAAGVAGLFITLSWKSDHLPTSDQIKIECAIAISTIPADIKPYVLGISPGNEPVYGDFWSTVGANKGATVEQILTNYVNLFLNPCYEVLNKEGFKIGCGGLNGDFGKHFIYIKSIGAKYDYVDLHPYCKTVSELKGKYADVIAANVNPVKPIVETETNTFLGKDYATGTVKDFDCLQQLIEQHNYKTTVPGLKYECYYMSRKQNTTTAGPFGLLIPSLDSRGNTVAYKTSPYYDLYVAALATA